VSIFSAKWGKRGIALLFGIFFSFLVFELGLRAAQYFIPMPLLHDLGKRQLLIKNHLRKKPGRKNLGFKDHDFTLQKKHRIRVVALGDSFVYGIVPHKDNYWTLLEEWGVAQGLDIEILNMGVPGAGPVEYLSVLRHEALFFHPDAVVVSFFVGNDFLDTIPQPRSWADALLTVRLFTNGKVFFESVRQPLLPAPVYRDGAATFKEEAFLEIEKKRSINFGKESWKLKPRWPFVRAQLDEMIALCREKGILIAFVLIPDQMQVDQDLQRQLSRKFPKDVLSEKMEWDAPNKLLRRYLSEQGVPYVDLLNAFRDRAGFYKPNDTHWNIAGNRFAAECIQPEFLRWIKGRAKPPEPSHA